MSCSQPAVVCIMMKCSLLEGPRLRTLGKACALTLSGTKKSSGTAVADMKISTFPGQKRRRLNNSQTLLHGGVKSVGAPRAKNRDFIQLLCQVLHMKWIRKKLATSCRLNDSPHDAQPTPHVALAQRFPMHCVPFCCLFSERTCFCN